MPEPFSNKKKQQWKEHILKQRESGLSIVHWCRQNHFIVRAFYYWQQKLFPKILDRSAFTEISDENNASSDKRAGVVIEYQGIFIHLDSFDPSTLKQCLEVLKERKC